ncbi:MAG: outer membrane beta-barrel protein [Myxococcaceae bacterium]|nr:outer membrane beta-barrel protein [Myxococcaceae bacterium]MCI0670834.1 outer membrane beta-barrel protein [Myxococcaceae bacterium]
MRKHAHVVSVLSLLWAMVASAAPGAPLPSPFGFGQETWTPEREREREVVVVEEPRRSDEGVYALVGGGLDGYTGVLGNTVNLGPTAGAIVGYKGAMLGLEGAYSASGADVSGVSAGPGLDIVRNSGQLAGTLGLLNEPLQPFLMGGIGLDFYRARNGGALGFQDATSFNIPVGGGLRYNITRFLTADARFNYNFLLGENFAPGDPAGNRYSGLLSIGGTL